MNKIFYLEDDIGIRSLVVYTLNATGFNARGFEHPDEFLTALEAETPDLILLDVMLPDVNGFDLLRSLKSNVQTADIPVIMITALGAEDDKVNALGLGADDYIAKPFGVMEMIARVRALLRRCADHKDAHLLQAGPICMNLSCHEVTVSERLVQLTPKEYVLLRMLMENDGRLVERERMFAEVWGGGSADANHSLDAHMRTLRAKLGDIGSCIQTVYSRGYRLRISEE